MGAGRRQEVAVGSEREANRKETIARVLSLRHKHWPEAQLEAPMFVALTGVGRCAFGPINSSQLTLRWEN